MKVKDLIEELKLYNPEQEIYGVIEDEIGTGTEEYLVRVAEGTYTKKIDGAFRICFDCYYV